VVFSEVSLYSRNVQLMDPFRPRRSTNAAMICTGAGTLREWTYRGPVYLLPTGYLLYKHVSGIRHCRGTRKTRRLFREDKLTHPGVLKDRVSAEEKLFHTHTCARARAHTHVGEIYCRENDWKTHANICAITIRERIREIWRKTGAWSNISDRKIVDRCTMLRVNFESSFRVRLRFDFDSTSKAINFCLRFELSESHPKYWLRLFARLSHRQMITIIRHSRIIHHMLGGLIAMTNSRRMLVNQ